MAGAGNPKTGGRQAGTPNRATRELKAFLDRVFAAAIADPLFEQHLVNQIVRLELDSRVLQTLLAYWAGAPPKHVEHRHTGASFADLVLGRVATDDDDQEATH